MDLVIKSLEPAENDPYPDDPEDFVVPVRVEIGEKNKEGAEAFHFTAASAQGLRRVTPDEGFILFRGCILMKEYDWHTVYRAMENLINHARSRKSWDEVVRYFNRWGVYDSEDLDGKFRP